MAMIPTRPPATFPTRPPATFPTRPPATVPTRPPATFPTRPPATRRRPPTFPLLVGALLACTAAVAASASAGAGEGGHARPLQEAPRESQRRAPLPGPARTEVAGGYWNGVVAVVGGWPADGIPSAQVDFYDPATDSWRPGPPLPVAVHHAGVGVLGDRLYVVGGFTNRADEGWAAHAGVVSLGPGDTAWREEPPLSEPRGALAVASTGSHLVAVGGVGGGDLRRTETLTAGDSRWRIGPDLQVRREHLAATAAGGRAYAIGGREFTLESNRASVESWAPGEGAWREEPLLNRSRGGTAAATPAGRPCVAGGEEPQGTIGPVECFVDGSWVEVAQMDVPRHGVAVVAVDRHLHVIGGGPQPGLYVSDVHEAFGL